MQSARLIAADLAALPSSGLPVPTERDSRDRPPLDLQQSCKVVAGLRNALFRQPELQVARRNSHIFGR